MLLKKCVILLIILSLFSINAVSSDKGDEILFLTLQITSEEITLIDSKVSQGKLKTPRTETYTNDIYFEVISKSENVLQGGGVDDPRIEIMEYEDPDNPGQLKHIEVVRDTANFVIRIQANQNLNHISFFRYDELTKRDGSIERSRVDLGRIDLSQIRGDQQ